MNPVGGGHRLRAFRSDRILHHVYGKYTFLVRRPRDLFDRDWEWEELARFATAPGGGLHLGVVQGRRRQGKSYLLQRLCEAVGGFYHEATEATARVALDRLGSRLAHHLGAPAPLALRDWPAALEAVAGLTGDRRPALVVLDEFPYLAHGSRELTSVVQATFDGHRRGPPVRLVLCGSLVRFMARLLAADRPLYGRARLALTIRPFDHATAAAFWGIRDPGLALRVHAVVGGTPAYRHDLVADDVPGGPSDFDPWVCRTVLNPARPLFAEGRYLLRAERELRDLDVYHSVLVAIAEGETTRGRIGGRLGRTSAEVAHPLGVLEDAGLVERFEDPFRQRRTTWRVAEPIVTFHHAIQLPHWTQLNQPRAPHAARVWELAQATWQARVLGPHFEHLVRQWCLNSLGSAIGQQVADVRPAVVNDRVRGRPMELDVVALSAPHEVAAIGEAKLERLGMADLDRLEHALALAADQNPRFRFADCRLLLASASGFEPNLRKAASGRDDVVLVSLRDVFTL